MATVFLALGSNLGDRHGYLTGAIDRIDKNIGPVLRQSSVYQTSPWINSESQMDYLNQVIQIFTNKTPLELLNSCMQIEKDLGRKGRTKWESREIDLDILFYDKIIFHKENLVIPHPFIHLRSFVLTPLIEIAPDLFHPVFNKTISELKDSCQDTGKVTTFNAING